MSLIGRFALWLGINDCCLPLKAVCCTDQPVFVDDGGTTGVASMEPQTDLPRQLPLASVLATNHPTPHGRTCATGWGEKSDDVVKMEMKQWCFFLRGIPVTSYLQYDLSVPVYYYTPITDKKENQIMRLKKDCSKICSFKTHLPQRASSDPSAQSGMKSHSGFNLVMHSPLSQVKVLSGHLAGKPRW